LKNGIYTFLNPQLKFKAAKIEGRLVRGGGMTGKFDYSTFLSPFTWRYGSPEMREIFSEINYRKTWRKIWVALAEAQSKYGLVTREELADLKSKMGPEHIDLKRAHEIEREIRHDIMAEIKTYAEQCPTGGGKIHLGATSMDIEDNAEVLRIKAALDIILTRLVNCLDSLSKQVTKFKDLPCIGWTHLQPAEPTTLGYRLAGYAQDLALDVCNVENLLRDFVRGKGIKGAVGTSASFQMLLKGKGKASTLEDHVMKKLGLESFPISTQTYPRKLDYLVLAVLAGIAQSLHKFGVDLRHLQSPAYGELSEPIGKARVGSSAMPFKKNPVSAERMCSLARYISTLPEVAWENAAQTILERTLDDSANRRIVLAESFLALDECLMICDQLARGLVVYPVMMKRNLERYAPFAATEAVLMKLVERGEDRQRMHEKLRELSFKAWEKVMAGEQNPLLDLLKKDQTISSKLSDREIDELLDPTKHLGDAGERCEKFVKTAIKPILLKHGSKVGKRRSAEF
jgi:adenylosuccinate lyase